MCIRDSSLANKLKNNYPFLTSEEVDMFIANHSWLKQEDDMSIIKEFLLRHIQSIADRHLAIYEMISKDQQQPEASPTNFLDNNSINDNDEQIILCIKSFDDIREEVLVKNSDVQGYIKIMKDFDTLVKALLENPHDESKKQITLSSGTRYRSLMGNTLVSLGFDQIPLDSDILYLYTKETVPIELFVQVNEMINADYLTTSSGERLDGAYFKDHQRVQAQQETMEKRIQERPNFLADIHENRLAQQQMRGQKKIGGDVPPSQTFGRRDNQAPRTALEYKEQVTNVKDQIQAYREKMKNQIGSYDSSFNRFKANVEDYKKNRSLKDKVMDKLGFGNGSKIITMDQIEKKRIEEDKVRFGLEALKHTNEFRKKNGLSELKWSQELCDIGEIHSKNMGDRKVPFGHHGFDERCKQVKFPFQSMRENVAYMVGYSDVAKTAVEGWINSPGHRKNLLSESNICGIGCYRASDGKWYLTQLLALTY
eukprot:TRINITY_DN2335_c0_g1_i1.p1 TRINITY_DN2335_c0_g1~~TRINITY_DN2335_c0_g1_i1.p1  ORF type:complete len:481 (+),score=51.51 TRINITY_DN2335_c0_g1_i1:67-1509(+)